MYILARLSALQLGTIEKMLTSPPKNSINFFFTQASTMILYKTDIRKTNNSELRFLKKKIKKLKNKMSRDIYCVSTTVFKCVEKLVQKKFPSAFFSVKRV